MKLNKMRNIYVHDHSMHHCSHWGYRVLTVLLLALCGFSTYVAYHNSKPICSDLRAIQVEYSRHLECVYDLGDIQEDQADVIIVK